MDQVQNPVCLVLSIMPQGESYFRALSSRLSSVGGSARRPGRITFVAKIFGTVGYCWNKRVEVGCTRCNGLACLVKFTGHSSKT